MFNSLLSSLKLWNKDNSDRAKLQHAYFVVIIVLVIVAGLITLLNVSLGRTLLGIAAFAGMVFVANAISWALLQTFVLSRLSTPNRPNKK